MDTQRKISAFSAESKLHPGFAFTICTADEAGKRANKTISPTETRDYDRVMYWRLQPVVYPTLDEFASALQELIRQPKSMLVRGAVKPGINLTERQLRRLEETFLSEPRAWITLDIDGVSVPPGLGAANKIQEAAVHIRDHILPLEFHNVRMVAVATSSTGRVGDDIARLRLFALLDRPISDRDQEDWTFGYRAEHKVALDPTICRAVQPVYTARPAFIGSEVDPVPAEKAVVILPGDRDHVALELEPYASITRERMREYKASRNVYGLNWRAFLQEHLGGEFSFYQPLSSAMGIAAHTDEPEDEIVAYTVELLKKKADPKRQRQYDERWLRRTLTSFRDKDQRSEKDFTRSKSYFSSLQYREDAGEFLRNAASEVMTAAPSPNAGQEPKSKIAPRAPKFRFPLVPFKDIRMGTNSGWLVKKLLPAQGVAVVYGGSQSFKTFLMLELALNVALGRYFAGRKVMQGDAIYIAAEGHGGLATRIEGWRNHYKEDKGVHEEIPFHLISVVPNLGEKDTDRKALIKDIAASQIAPRVIVIDTLVKTLGAGEENGQGMISFMSNAEAIAQQFKCLVIAVHHTPLADNERLRGHTSLYAGVDAAILCKRVEGSLKTELSVKKLKEQDSLQKFTAALKLIEVGRDEDDEAITTLVVEDIKAGDGEEVPIPLNEKRTKILRSLQSGPLTQAEIERRTDLAKSTVGDLLSKMRGEKLICRERSGKRWRLLKAGEAKIPLLENLPF